MKRTAASDRLGSRKPRHSASSANRTRLPTSSSRRLRAFDEIADGDDKGGGEGDPQRQVGRQPRQQREQDERREAEDQIHGCAFMREHEKAGARRNGAPRLYGCKTYLRRLLARRWPGVGLRT